MDPQRPLSVELFKQSIKLALGATALVVLVLINSNIHQMVLCLMRAPLDKVASPDAQLYQPHLPSRPRPASGCLSRGRDRYGGLLSGERHTALILSRRLHETR